MARVVIQHLPGGLLHHMCPNPPIQARSRERNRCAPNEGIIYFDVTSNGKGLATDQNVRSCWVVRSHVSHVTLCLCLSCHIMSLSLLSHLRHRHDRAVEYKRHGLECSVSREKEWGDSEMKEERDDSDDSDEMMKGECHSPQSTGF